MQTTVFMQTTVLILIIKTNVSGLTLILTGEQSWALFYRIPYFGGPVTKSYVVLYLSSLCLFKLPSLFIPLTRFKDY